ncbi:MAG: FAD-dependent oxidoreductase, partial [Synechococcaceae bacterium WB9_3_282]|nr:FAD-dependent oxidoreductase [Synechococcaceae bacterium WB9_3_282]
MNQDTLKVPVLVLGGGTGALGAALQCARSGTKCLLVTPGPWVGGMLSASGVSAPDGNELTPWQTGLWGALLRELRIAVPEGLDNNWVSCFGFQPAQAEKIFQNWIRAEPNLKWMSGWNLQELTKKNKLLTGGIFSNGINQLQVKFDLIIDGTELAESMVYADVPYRLGWEAKEEWDEPSAPEKIKLEQDPFFQTQVVQSPTWVFLARWQGDWNESSQVFRQNKQPAAPFQDCLKPHGLLRCLSYGRLPEDLLMLNWPINGNDWHEDPLAPFSGSTNR